MKRTGMHIGMCAEARDQHSDATGPIVGLFTNGVGNVVVVVRYLHTGLEVCYHAYEVLRVWQPGRSEDAGRERGADRAGGAWSGRVTGGR